MKAQRPYPTITITPKGERALLGGHPWVYDAEITAQSGPIAEVKKGAESQKPSIQQK